MTKEDPSRWTAVSAERATQYDTHWAKLEEQGIDPHGEASFIERFAPTRVLDAGCGTGRVAIELTKRGIETVGVDLDEPMLDQARIKAPHIDWHLADLVDLRLEERFDVVAMPGNVMIFVAPGTEGRVVGRLVDHVAPGGYLIAGFTLRPQGYGIDDYEAHLAAAGLSAFERFSTWDRNPWNEGDDYVVSVARLEDASAVDVSAIR